MSVPKMNNLDEKLYKLEISPIAPLKTTDRLYGVVVSMFDYLEIFLGKFSQERGLPSLMRTIGQLLYINSVIRLRKLKLRFSDNVLLTTSPPTLSSGSNGFCRSWVLGTVAVWIYLFY